MANNTDGLGAWVLRCAPGEQLPGMGADWRRFLLEGRSTIRQWKLVADSRTAALTTGQPVVFWVAGDVGGFPAGVWGIGVVGAVPTTPTPDPPGDTHGPERPTEARKPASQILVTARVSIQVSGLRLPRATAAESATLAVSELFAPGPATSLGMLTPEEYGELLALVDAESRNTWPSHNRPALEMPFRRRLRTYAFDPMTTRLTGTYLSVDVPFEPDLQPGPIGQLVTVADYDAAHDAWYVPVDLNDPTILVQGGLKPAEHDPRTHQQVVYAVAMSVLERFERFVGRRFRWRGGRRLLLIPHAIEDENAYFDARTFSVRFGYYRADRDDPGANLPGQTMFTCLSSDIIAHEVTHAIMHRTRQFFDEATNPDVYAWHEAFADLIALFQHFAYLAVVRDAINSGDGDLTGGGLLALAQEFGAATGRGRPLREALGAQPPLRLADLSEPHERGSCFVAAVFDAFLAVHRRRITDLLRIATGGSGQLPPGSPQADLVNRIAREAVWAADTMLGMVVRGLDYQPVVDVTFGDVVRAIITADHGLYPDDYSRLRSTLIESMRERGIYPEGVASLADEELMWPRPTVPLTLYDGGEPTLDLRGLILNETLNLDPTGTPAWRLKAQLDEAGNKAIYDAISAWAGRHALELGLQPGMEIQAKGFHVSYRRAQDRQPRPEIVVQLMQRRVDLEDERFAADRRVPFRAGTTVIANVDGQVSWIVRKPLPFLPETVAGTEWSPVHQGYHRDGQARYEAMRSWCGDLDGADELGLWVDESAALRLNFARLHAERRDRVARRRP